MKRLTIAACPLAPCLPEQWTELGEVTLPATFFLPPFAGDGG